MSSSPAPKNGPARSNSLKNLFTRTMSFKTRKNPKNPKDGLLARSSSVQMMNLASLGAPKNGQPLSSDGVIDIPTRTLRPNNDPKNGQLPRVNSAPGITTTSSPAPKNRSPLRSNTLPSTRTLSLSPRRPRLARMNMRSKRSQSWRIAKSSRSLCATNQTMPMAIMKNPHEVIRGAMKDIQLLLDKDQLKEAGKVWKDLDRFNKLHMLMEQGLPGVALGLFQMMDDHIDNAAKTAGLRNLNPMLAALAQKVKYCLVKKPHLGTAQRVFPDWMDRNEYVLLKKEDVLLPSVQAMVLEDHPIKQYIRTYMMPVLTNNPFDMMFFIQFANQVLERHDSGGRVRMFDQALWSVATPAQWELWSTWMETALSPTKYEEVIGQIKSFVDLQKAKQQALEVPRVAQPKSTTTTTNPVEC